MKTLISMLISLLIVAGTYAQSPIKLIKERVGNPDILKSWEVGDYKYVNGIAILREEGENTNELDHLTNLFYTPESHIINIINKKAEAENLTATVKDDMITDYEKAAPGGQITLFYSRDEKRLADPTLFTVNVRNYYGELVHQKKLLKEEPYCYKSGIWYYYKTINIPQKVGETFTLQVRDEGSGNNYTFIVIGNVGDNEEIENFYITTASK